MFVSNHHSGNATEAITALIESKVSHNHYILQDMYAWQQELDYQSTQPTPAGSKIHDEGKTLQRVTFEVEGCGLLGVMLAHN